MTLHTPRHFAAPHDEAVALITAYPFATLVTTVAGAEPAVAHLPLLWCAGDTAALEGHIARANPQADQFEHGAALAVFHGPQAYVSPAWYTQPQREVPTWNYAAVHVHGRIERIDARAEKLALLDRAVLQFEAGRSPSWTRSVDGARLEALLGGIVAFRLVVARIEATFKMSQNKPPLDRAGVIAGLAQGDAAARAVAQWMQAHDAG